MLAQLQLGKEQLLGQEYPAASLLDNGPDIPPSCDNTAGNKNKSNKVNCIMVESTTTPRKGLCRQLEVCAGLN